MKDFVFGALIDKGDLCNREEELRELTQKALSKKKTVIFAPRKYGKSSLLKNIIPQEFEKVAKRPFVVYVDLLSVTSLEAIASKLAYGLSSAKSKYTKIKSIQETLLQVTKSLSLSATTTAMSESMGVEFKFSRESLAVDKIAKPFNEIKELQKTLTLMIVLDEFQDISGVDGADGILREHLQDLKDSSIFYLGSRMEMITKMFSYKGAFYGMASEYSIGDIKATEWHTYFRERLRSKKVKLGLKAIEFLCESVMQVPNAICEFGSYIKDNYESVEITSDQLSLVLLNLLESKQQVYEEHLGLLSQNERTVLEYISTKRYIGNIETVMVVATGLSRSGIKGILEDLLNKKVIERLPKKGIRVSNPFLNYYLSRLKLTSL